MHKTFDLYSCGIQSAAKMEVVTGKTLQMKTKASDDKAFFAQRMTAAIISIILRWAGFIAAPGLGKDCNRNPSGSGKGKQQMENVFQQTEVSCSCD